MQTLGKEKIRDYPKKSQLLLLGSLLVFLGVSILLKDYIAKAKSEVFAEMRIDTQAEQGNVQDVVDAPIADNLTQDSQPVEEEKHPVAQEIDYSKYLGVLEIPKIGLKRGFYNIDSRYNNIQYNVTMVKGSTLPNVEKGNLILMAHSGWAAISYFEYLYNLRIGDVAYVTYNGQKYVYSLVNTYDVPKNGHVKISRNYEKTTLTLITCTRNSDTLQTVYILELV